MTAADPAKRVTVYFEPGLHRAIRLKSAYTNQSVSQIVNDASEYLAAGTGFSPNFYRSFL